LKHFSKFFFADTHVHTHEGIALPLLCMRTRGKTTMKNLAAYRLMLLFHPSVHPRG